MEILEKWLTKRALEHDQPSFLLSLVIEKLFAVKIFRPGLSVLERLVLKAREEAVNETYWLLLPILDDETKAELDKLVEIKVGKKKSNLVWLRQRAVSFAADAILTERRFTAQGVIICTPDKKKKNQEVYEVGHRGLWSRFVSAIRQPIESLFN